MNEQKITVLIADDEPIMRKAMQSLIDWDALGCHLVYVASTGLEVMEYLNAATKRWKEKEKG